MLKLCDTVFLEDKDQGVLHDKSKFSKVKPELAVEEAVSEGMKPVVPIAFEDMSDTGPSKLVSWSDILIAYPTVEGYISLRDPKSGTWFSTVFCETFKVHSHNSSLLKMLRKVNKEIKRKESLDGTKQTTTVVLMGWSKKLYFNPGL